MYVKNNALVFRSLAPHATHKNTSVMLKMHTLLLLLVVVVIMLCYNVIYLYTTK